MNVIYETKNFIAVQKPAGVLVHPVKVDENWPKSGNKETVLSWALDKYPEIKKVGDRPDLRPGIVHRLDRDTSGVFVIARTQEFFNYFKKLLKERDVEKKYLALVWGRLDKEGIIEKDIGLKPGTTRQTTWTDNAKMVKNAKTLYKSLEYFQENGDEFTLVELQPKTGRTHQLRVHMASIHNSIVGDPRYGKKDNPWGLKRQLLHARLLSFVDMQGKRIRFESNLPDDFKNILNDLNSDCLKKLEE